MKHCILLGDRSAIAKALLPFLVADGYTVSVWNRETIGIDRQPWDLFLCALGRVAPVGHWHEQYIEDVVDCFNSNLLLPLELLRELWPSRKQKASACFMAGSNPQKIMSGYMPYNVSKMALLKAVEQIDHESPDCNVFALGPGYFRDSPIHDATLKANWPNERIARGDAGTPIERIWGCLKWCIEQPKNVVGGRNITASDPWDTPELAERLAANTSMFKLRRAE